MPPIKQKVWTDDKIIEAMRACGALPTDCARYLTRVYNRKCVRSTITAAIRESERVKQVAEECQGVAYEIAYAGVFERAQQGNPRDQRLLLAKLAPKFMGPQTQKIELTGADGKPVEIHSTKEAADGAPPTQQQLRDLSDEELDKLILAAQVLHGTK